ncbi:hypothetical protein [Microbacterium maritypicum]
MIEIPRAEVEWLSVPVGDWTSALGVLFSILTAVVAAFAFGSLRKRERRQALTDLHASLTSGETAAARNVIGTLLHSPNSREHPSRLDSISAYFTLIWSLQRARNVFRTQLLPAKELNAPMSKWERLVPGRLRDATEALTWNLDEIAGNIVRFHDVYGTKWNVEDDDAWAEISAYINAERLRPGAQPRSVRDSAADEPPVHTA